MKTLFEQDLKVVNVGLQSFAANIAAAGGGVSFELVASCGG